MARRPHNDKPLPYNPVRWVCQHRHGTCGGKFKVRDYGDLSWQPCPLAAVCNRADPQLEYLYPGEPFPGAVALDHPPDPLRSRRHTKENTALRRCFFPDIDKGYYAKIAPQYNETRRAKRAANADEINAVRREKYAQKRAAEGKPIRRPIELTPPCGGDCENCPYPDEPCRYEDWDQKKARQHEKYRRRWQRIKSDPQKLAAYNADNRARRAKKKKEGTK